MKLPAKEPDQPRKTGWLNQLRATWWMFKGTLAHNAKQYERAMGCYSAALRFGENDPAAWNG